MSCLWCKYYVKLNEECEKGFEVKTTYESFGCSEYEYNGECKIDDDL